MTSMSKWLLIAALSVAACDKGSQSSSPPAQPAIPKQPVVTAAPTPPTPAAPAAMPQPAAPAAPASADGVVVKTIKVRQEGTSRGVVADIRRIAEDDKSFFFARTNDDGVAEPNRPCVPVDRFEVEPQIQTYLKVRSIQCAQSLEFELPSVKATYAMISLGEEAAAAGKYGDASAYFTLAAGRLQVNDAPQAVLLQSKARVAFGKSLGVENAVHVENGKEVFTPEAQAKLRAFQREKGIAATGEVDERTAEGVLGAKHRDIAKQASELPQSRIDYFKEAQTKPSNALVTPAMRDAHMRYTNDSVKATTAFDIRKAQQPKALGKIDFDKQLKDMVKKHGATDPLKSDFAFDKPVKEVQKRSAKDAFKADIANESMRK